MTPCQSYENAMHRDAGHDEMQAAVYDFLCSRTVHPMDGKIPGEVFTRDSIEIEMPITIKGKIVCWADLAEIWMSNSRVTLRRRLTIYEIKPIIHSVGSVIRQCKTLEYQATHNEDLPVLVVAVVPINDPKVGLLEKFWPVWKWDANNPKSTLE